MRESQEPRAVVNASPLIFLAKIDQLERLPEPVATTPQIVEEVTDVDPVEYPEAPLVDAFLGGQRARIRETKGTPPEGFEGLHPGERSVLALAIDAGITTVIVDDRAAIRAAKLHGLEPTSTPFVLLEECRRGKMTYQRFQRCLQRLTDHRYFLSPDLYQRLLDEARKGSGQ